MAYGGDMATRRQQTKELLTWLADAGHPVVGDQVKTYVIAQGWNSWQVSILLSQLVKDGLLDVVGLWSDTPGHTYRKTYLVTPIGMGYLEKHSDAPEDSGVDTSDAEIRARDVTPGKWVILPAGVGHRQVVLLRDKGFEVRRVIRYVGESSGKQ